MLDKTAWKLNDKEWCKKRIKKWCEIEKWFDERGLWSEDFEIQQRKAYREFFESGNVHKDFDFWEDLVLLHPAPDVEDIRKLISLRPEYQGEYWLTTGSYYYPLKEKGLISDVTLRNMFIAACGYDYNEMASLRGFDPRLKVKAAVRDLFPLISNWFKAPNPESLPMDLLLRHLETTIPYINEDNVKSAKFSLKKLSQRAAKYKDDESIGTEMQVKVAKQIADCLLSEEAPDCVRAIAKEYIC